MGALVIVGRIIDGITGLFGRIGVALMPFVVLIAAAVVLLRYLFNLGYPWLSESFIWLNGFIFMIAAAYVLQVEGHVRVDVFYSRLGARGRALVNVFGVTCLLWPAIWVLFTRSIPIVERSWRMKEASPTPDGLPVMYLFKACLLVFCVLLLLQGLSLLLKSVAAFIRPATYGHLLARSNDMGAPGGEASRA